MSVHPSLVRDSIRALAERLAALDGEAPDYAAKVAAELGAACSALGMPIASASTAGQAEADDDESSPDEAQFALEATCEGLADDAFNGKLRALAYIAVGPSKDGERDVWVGHVGNDDAPLNTLGAMETLRDEIHSSVHVATPIGRYISTGKAKP